MRLQAAAAALTTAAVLMFVFGTAWDVQWHVSVGRDRLFTAPHQLMLTDIALAGLTSLAIVLIQRRRVNGGVVLSGIGALLAAIAFVLDDYWHSLYGIDVAIWAPFHVMIITGVGTAGLGALFQFGATPGRIRPQVGFGVALGATLATFMVLLPESAGRQAITIVGGVPLVLYPVLVTVALTTSIGVAALGSRRGGTALLMALLVIGLRQALFAFVPWATTTFAAIEGQSFRPNQPVVTITPHAFPGLSLVLVALAAEAALWWSRRRAVSPTGSVLFIVTATAIASAYAERPWDVLVPRFYADADLAAVGFAAVPFTVLTGLLGSGLGLALAMAVRPHRRAATDGPSMRLLRAPAAALLAVLLLVVGGSTSLAHDYAPLSATQARVGPYPLEVRYYSEPIGGRELQFEIVPSGAGAAPVEYHAVAVPGPTTNAVPVTARMQVTEHAGAIGIVNLPVSGRWLLSIDVEGPLGAASGEAPIVVAPVAAALPDWVAWLIGTLPVSVSLAFVGLRLMNASRRVVPSPSAL